MLVLPNTFYDDNNSGHLISRITYSVGGVTTAADAIKVVVRERLSVIIAILGLLLWIN